jgi:dTDP-6-deoxy-L-talose 4-dehydrogenase (NAD+)
MKALVVGGTGFLGSEISKRLVSEGIKIKTLNRSFSPRCEFAQTKGDIRFPETYETLVKEFKPDVVISAAWVTELNTYRDDPLNKDFEKATIRFADFCYRNGVEHFLGLGTCSEYGVQDLKCFAGKTNLRPADLYSQTKVNTFLELRDLSSSYSSRLTWARVFQPFGHNQDPKRLIPYLIDMCSQKKPIILQNAQNVVDLISSRDVAAGIYFAISQKLPQELDLGSGVAKTIFQIASEISTKLKTNPALITFDDNHTNQIQIGLATSPESPLFKAGWKTVDTLESCLPWVMAK